MLLILRVNNQKHLKGQDGDFLEEKGFFLCNTENENEFPPGFKPPIHGLRGELSTNELFDLLMSGHRINRYQIALPLSVILRTCLIVARHVRNDVS